MADAISPESICHRHGKTIHRNGVCLVCLFGDLTSSRALISARRFQQTIKAAENIQRTRRRFPGYQILAELGRGGMGMIYRARDINSSRVIALKCLFPSDLNSDSLRGRFFREARALASLEHPSIIPVYHVGRNNDGQPFFTMKLASRGALNQPHNRPSDVEKIVSLILSIAKAIQYAHDRGIFHRDLKPSNILFEEPEAPLVSDFGLAKSVNHSGDATRTMEIFGTPGYLPPERFGAQKNHSPASEDIYAIGAILFELLTDKLPLVRSNSSFSPTDTVRPSKVRSLAPQVDRNLATICSRCLEFEPSHRYPSCAALMTDLENWRDHRPISVRRVPRVKKLVRIVVHDHKLAACLLALFLLFVTGSAWFVSYWRSETIARNELADSRSILVLPFWNLDTVGTEQTLTESAASMLEHELKLLGPAQVKKAAPNEILTYGDKEQVRNLGRLTKCRIVLQGTIRHLPTGKERISIRLIDSSTLEPAFIHVGEDEQAATDIPFWGKVSGPIYGILSSSDPSGLSSAAVDPGMRSQSASEAIRAGRDLTRRYGIGDLDRAISLFTKAIQLEPNSSLAHSYLAIAETVRTHYVANTSYVEMAKGEATKAVQLAPFSSEAHRALAGVYYQEGQFPAALEEGFKTIEMCGVDEKVSRFLGMTFDTMGRLDHALKWYHFATHLQGTPGDVDAQLGDCWSKLGNDERALEAYVRSEHLQPRCTDGAVGICHTLMLQRNYVEARRYHSSVQWKTDRLSDGDAIAAQIEFFARDFALAKEIYETLTTSDPDGGGSFYGAVSYQSALGRTMQGLGDKNGARKKLQRCLEKETAIVSSQPQNPEALYRLAAVEACLGMLKSSIDHLSAAADLGWRDIRSLVGDPRFDAIRESPQYQRIIDQLSANVAEMRSKAEHSNLWRSDKCKPRIGMN
jgi:serine/threonine protein kinase/tetratricopeptide (TPR) repeat protein